MYGCFDVYHSVFCDWTTWKIHPPCRTSFPSQTSCPEQLSHQSGKKPWPWNLHWTWLLRGENSQRRCVCVRPPTFNHHNIKGKQRCTMHLTCLCATPAPILTQSVCGLECASVFYMLALTGDGLWGEKQTCWGQRHETKETPTSSDGDKHRGWEEASDRNRGTTFKTVLNI